MASTEESEPEGRHDPNDVQVSGQRWKLNYDPNTKTANFRQAPSGVLLASFTETQYDQVRRDFANLEEYSKTKKAEEQLEETSFDDVNSTFKDLLSIPVDDDPDMPPAKGGGGRGRVIKSQLLANVSLNLCHVSVDLGSISLGFFFLALAWEFAAHVCFGD